MSFFVIDVFKLSHNRFVLTYQGERDRYLLRQRYLLKLVSETYLELSEVSMTNFFSGNSLRLLAVDYFRKKNTW